MTRRGGLATCGALVVLLASGCAQRREASAPDQSSTAPSREVTFATSDGWTLRADWYPCAGARGAVVLLHERGGSAADWRAVAPMLVTARLAVLALDQRGAGRSRGASNGPDAPWETGPDIEAAVRWLAAPERGLKLVALAGSSYGANNALLYAAAHPEVRSVALVSPGSDYHGLRIRDAARTYGGRALVIWASGDSITGGGPEILERAMGARADVRAYPGTAHGVAIFDEHPDARDAFVAFLAAAP